MIDDDRQPARCDEDVMIEPGMKLALFAGDRTVQLQMAWCVGHDDGVRLHDCRIDLTVAAKTVHTLEKHLLAKLVKYRNGGSCALCSCCCLAMRRNFLRGIE